ncbi:MAG: alpha/beta fold hydrolase BchO [Pseudomonadota bacterium]
MFFAPEKLNFDRDGRDWPHRESSRFVDAAGLTWHVQERSPEGVDAKKTVVLIHGTGASTHSWRAIFPILSERYRVLAFDLPGQGFTDSLSGESPTLPKMAKKVEALFQALNLEGSLVVGHSAGAAIALQLALNGAVTPHAVVSINGALYPFPGAASAIFPMLAKVLFLNPVVPHVFAMGAGGRHRVERLLEGTGSKLDDEGLSLYQRLFKNPAHVRATLAWMANWNLEPLVEAMPDIKVPFLQIIGSEDETIAPANAYVTQSRIKHAEMVKLAGFGHLVHEEDPQIVADHIVAFAEKNAF